MQKLSISKISNKFLNARNFKFNLQNKSISSHKNFSSGYDKIFDNKPGNTIEDIIKNNNPDNSLHNHNNYVPNSTHNQVQNKKRLKISFLRDGMLITLYLRKTIIEIDKRNEGYVFLELKEYSEEYSSTGDPRFILLKGVSLGKFSLITPKCHIIDSNKLERIGFTQKFRSLDIQQNSENKYVFTLKVVPKDQEGNTGDNLGPPIVSQIELNPEDMVVLQKFVDKCMNELLNF